MMSPTLALSLFAAIAAAQPHRNHMARHEHAKRDMVVVTEVDWTTEIVPMTVTIYVDPASDTSSSFSSSFTSTSAADDYHQVTSSSYVAPSPSATPEPSSSSSSSSSVYVAPSSSSTYVAPASSTYIAPSSSEAPSSSSVYVAPSSSSVYVAPSSSSVYVAPSSSSVYVAPSSSSTPTSSYTPPSSTSSAVTASSTSTSSTSSGECTEDSPCDGDITYYEAGLGACGTTTDGTTTNVVALPYELMGTESNDNPYCGKTITVSYGGKTIEAEVVDKCMGCTGYSIDLSEAAFTGLAELAVGRAEASWWFN